MKLGMTSRPDSSNSSAQPARLNSGRMVRAPQSWNCSGASSGTNPLVVLPVMNSSARHESKYWMSPPHSDDSALYSSMLPDSRAVLSP